MAAYWSDFIRASNALFRLGMAALLCWLAPQALAAAPVAADASVATGAEIAGEGAVRASARVVRSVTPQRHRAAIRLEHAPGWHTYWSNPGTGAATKIAWDLPAGWRAGAIDWPVPIIIRGGKGQPTGHGYEGVTYLPITLEAPAGAKPGSRVRLTAQVSWLMCQREICVPGKADLPLDVEIQSGPAVLDAAWDKALQAQAMPKIDRAARIGAWRSGGAIGLSVAGLGAVRDPHFFPATEMIWHDAKQAFDTNGERVSLSVPQDKYWEGATDRLSGVLAYTDAKGRYRGVVVDAPFDPRAAAQAARMGSGDGEGSGAGPLGMTLLFAFLGGLILNLMPCVLPVLSLKALSLAQGGKGDARREGVHYSLGVLFTFLLVGGAMLALRSALGGIGWGFQLQNPFVALLLALLMAAIGFNLAGLAEVSGRFAGAGQGLLDGAGRSKSFLTGALAVIVATPCTAPFMAAALGAALLAPPLEALLIFFCLGLGMAAPFLLLAFWPPARKILPKPGAWMESFRLILAFPMFATAIWLLWVLGKQRGVDAMALGLLGVAGLALALQAWPRAAAAAGLRRAVWGLALLAGVGGIALACFAMPGPGQASGVGTAEAARGATGGKGEIAYTPEALDAALASGQPVFAYFTADWCVTCKVNERVALHTDATAKLFADKKVKVFVGDWTSQNPEITAILAEYGRAGVPLYLYFPPGVKAGEAKVLPQILTPAIIAGAIG